MAFRWLKSIKLSAIVRVKSIFTTFSDSSSNRRRRKTLIMRIVSGTGPHIRGLHMDWSSFFASEVVLGALVIMPAGADVRSVDNTVSQPIHRL